MKVTVCQNAAPMPLHEKYYLPDEPGYWEHTWYDRGAKNFDVGRVLGMRLGVQICTEMWFFEWARHYAAARVDLLCIPRATPQHASVDKWLAGGQAAAVCSGAYCLSPNLWAEPDAGPDLGGLGWMIAPKSVGAILGLVILKPAASNPQPDHKQALPESSHYKTHPEFPPAQLPLQPHAQPSHSPLPSTSRPDAHNRRN